MLEKNNLDNLIVCGDIHGQWNEFIKNINKYDISDSHIIIVGDIGIGFQSNKKKEIELLNNVSENLNDRNIYVSCYRGNHDNPKWFETLYTTKNKRLSLYPDFTYIETPKGVLCFWGGGISIDRIYRIVNYQEGGQQSWWSDEVINFDFNKIKAIKNVDLMFTHSAPTCVEPIGFDAPILKEFSQIDNNLMNHLKEERNTLIQAADIILSNNNLLEWNYGHFHMDRTSIYKDIFFHCNDILKFRKI